MEHGKVEDLLEHWYKKFQKIPEEAHLLCPKVDDDDEEDYDDPAASDTLSADDKKKRIQDGQDRIEIVYWTSLLMAYGKDKAGVWLSDWTDRMATYMHTCDKCVLNWHMNRKKFIRKYAVEWDDSLAQQVEDCLHRYDFDRLNRGIGWAVEIIDTVETTEGRAFQKSDLKDQVGLLLLTIYETLCCMAYLSDPARRASFQKVFERLQPKKPLKMGENVVLPAMTWFLFDKEPTRHRFAVSSWERLQPLSLTQDKFDWAVHDHIIPVLDAAATWDISMKESLPEIQRFWEGMNYILKTLDGELMLRGIRSLDPAPRVVELLFNHIHCNSEAILLFTLQAMSTIIKTAPQLIRDTINDARPIVVVEQIFRTPLIRTLLAQSVAYTIHSGDGTSNQAGDRIECAAISWIDVWIRSLKISEMSDGCEQLLRLLFRRELQNDTLGDQGKAACIRAGLDALAHVLQSFVNPSVNLINGSMSLYVNATLNVTLSYKDLINDALNRKSQAFDTLGVHKAAMSVVKAALTLDAKATAAEHQELRREEQDFINADKPEEVRPANLQMTVSRHSPALWEAFMDSLRSNNLPLAQNMLLAMGPLISLNRFLPKRKKPNSLDKVRVQLGDATVKTAAVCGRIMQRLCDYSKEDLELLLYKAQTIRPVLALNLHGEDELRDSSKELVKTITGVFSHSDALLELLHQRLEVTLASLNYGLLQIHESKVLTWGPAVPIITTSRNVLNALCDPTSGILRSRVLELGEEVALSTWWSAQWKYLEKAFDTTAHWSHFVEVDKIKDFCRNSIEHADDLMAQCGLIASALQQKEQRNQQAATLSGNTPSGMHRLLKEPTERLTPIVNMVRLRDPTLVATTVQVVVRLLVRLRENDHEIPQSARDFIHNVCTKGPDGRYITPSNATSQQRAELLKALGEEEEDDVEVISIQPASAATKKKQTSLDAWSKSGSSGSSSAVPRSRSNKDDVLSLSSSVDKNRSLLDKISARQSGMAKTKPLPLKAKIDPSSTKALIESRKAAKADKAKRDAEAIAKAQALRGPEIKGLSGVVGKDHAPSKNEIMVDSDDDESSDDSEDEDVKALINKGQLGQKAKDEATRRQEQILLEKTRGPVKKQRIVRSAKDMRARLIPPMDQLHQAILEWDIFFEGNDPPTLEKCARVADTYPHPEAYKQTFWKLLVSEAWRSFVTSKDEATSKPFGIKIASRMSIDRFLEVTASMPKLENKERGLSEGDIILLSQSSNPLSDPNEPHALARIWKTAYKKDMLEVTYRLNMRNNPLQSNLHISAELYAAKITNMTTIEREYAALESLKYYDLMDEVLKAEPSPVLKYSDELVNQVLTNYTLNPGQAKAILGARDNDGFTLIQGPPGTGKTKTIVAMVGALMTGNIPQSGGVRLATGGANQAAGQKKKILVCAPSNAAVDELVLRLKQGIRTMSGNDHKINVLRLGRSDAINAAVRDVTLDELVKKRLEGDNTAEKLKTARDKLHSDAAGIRDKVNELRPALEAARGTDRELEMTLQRQFDSLKREQFRIGTQIDADKESGQTISREVEIKRKQVQQEILDSAQVLCATLSGSGHEMFKNLSVDFETVIIDEAAQCVELSALIPLKYGCTKCILVGDPKQLPPTVLSQSAARFGYDQSLFVRMQRNHPEYIHMLDTQYRMHPEISYFPSQEFYEAKLVDGPNMAGLRRQAWHASPLLGPYRFFDVQGTQERGRKGQSLVNLAELKVAMQIYSRFRTDFGRDGNIAGKIGIITPYKAQLFELRNRFAMEYGDQITNDIEFNTTDAFQGRECEIIIFSCVRASPTGGIGFMKDIRRMNVGLTRAKSSLWILGDSRALMQGEFWAKLIDNAKQRNLYTQGDVLSMLQKPSHTLRPALPNAEYREVSSRDGPPPTGPRAQTDHSHGRGEAQAWSARPDAPPQIQTSAPPRPGGAPQIQTSAPDSKKRPRDGDGPGHPNAKRMASGSNDRAHHRHGDARAAPTGPKAHRNPRGEHWEGRETKPKTTVDPSAMAALGLVAPERPPAVPTASTGATCGPSAPTTGLNRVNQIQQRAQAQGQNPGQGPPRKKKPKGNGMFIERKPPRRD
ncbi:hypothetical protein VDGD_01785 [Verticillium dahliae]|nr:hypothetical protein VDGD_01785 [Verticillium dahliae]